MRLGCFLRRPLLSSPLVVLLLLLLVLGLLGDSVPLIASLRGHNWPAEYHGHYRCRRPDGLVAAAATPAAETPTRLDSTRLDGRKVGAWKSLGSLRDFKVLPRFIIKSQRLPTSL